MISFKIATAIAICLVSIPLISIAQKSPSIAPQLHEGDIVFQKIPCGSLCDAIIETTPCKPGRIFNHCGIVHKENNQVYIIEAIGKQVKQSDITTFLKRDTSRYLYVGRLKKAYKSIIPLATQKATKYIGTPYDNAFLPSDSALYCSELIYDSYLDSANPLFTLTPMTFKSPTTGNYYKGWIDYYKELNMPIPEGLPGINPCALANDNKLSILRLRK